MDMDKRRWSRNVLDSVYCIVTLLSVVLDRRVEQYTL